ncbi:MAG: hypothetical protein IKH50_08785, partial [Oscillospiraceae bacterium]|nr:hypothetical protein [Oscillospiraceae bacterium]
MILQDFYDGKAFDAYEFFGAHPQNGKTVFRTYAPAASSVKVIGSFNGWKGVEMTHEGRSGVFTYVSDNARAGDLYKFQITSRNGSTVDHCDPYGFGMELRPASASIVTDLSGFEWHDREWMEKRTRNF